MVIQLSTECCDLLSLQHGVLARWQAAGCGLDPSAIDNLLRRGRWQKLYRSVYAAYTGAVSRDSAIWAAWCRCGPDAALSHFTAAELDGILGRRTESIHVTIPGQRRLRIPEREFKAELPRIIVHRSARIGDACHPAKTPPRTRVEESVLDLIELAPDAEVAFSWLSAACGGRQSTPDQIRSAVTRRSKLRWRADVLIALEEISDGVLSHTERRYLRNVERPHGLPRAKRQVHMKRGPASAYLDNLYPDFGVAVELDGRAAHPVEARWQDIHRDNYFASTGIITLRYSWADITTRPCLVARQIALVLRQRGWTGTLRSCGPSCRATFA